MLTLVPLGPRDPGTLRSLGRKLTAHLGEPEGRPSPQHGAGHRQMPPVLMGVSTGALPST